MKIGRLYDIAREYFGPQGWWPTTTPRGLVPIYRPGREKRRITKREAFEILVGAILTQNTAWTNAERAVTGLKKEGLLIEERLAETPPDRIAPVIRPAGYYNMKAARISNVARGIMEVGGVRGLLAMETDALRAFLLSLSGIGKETADSFILYGGARPVFVVDAYTKRILTRHGLAIETSGYDEIQDLFHSSLPRDAALFNDYHAQIVAIGKRFCGKRPRCDECPIGAPAP